MWWIAVIAVIFSLIGAFYYLRIVKLMFFDEPADALDRPLAPALRGTLALGTAVTLFFFVMPGPLVRAAGAAAASLFPG
jgi:NADH-quinone oxidoreductase subunit N